MDTTNQGTPLPKPRLILRVGGLGNRKFGTDNGLNEDPGQIELSARKACVEVWSEIRRILDEILASDRNSLATLTAHRRPAWLTTHFAAAVFFFKPNRWGWESSPKTPIPAFEAATPLVQVLTGSEPGGDTIVRETARETHPEWQHVPVDVKSPDEVRDGLGVGRPRPKRADPAETLCLSRADASELASIARDRAYAFRAQSEALRHHSDILLAVWDPDAEGKAGGTSESVANALREHIPVIAVLVRGESKAETFVLTRPADLEAAMNGVAAGDKWREPLKSVLKELLAFPDPEPDHHSNHEAPTTYHPRLAYQLYLSGRPLGGIWPGWVWQVTDRWASYRAAVEAFNRKSREYEDPDLGPAHRQAAAAALPTLDEARRKAWQSFLERLGFREREVASPAEPLPNAPPTPGSFAATYGRARARASSSGLSGVFGDAHRGAIVASYLLAAAAVLTAVVGGILHATQGPILAQALTAGAEMISILLMFALSVVSKAENWHTAYTDGRILAEALRYMEQLGPLGVHTPIPRLPQHLAGAKSAQETERAWTIWYFRALVRAAPLRLTSPTEAGEASNRLEECRERLLESIATQQRYHRKNAAKQSQSKQDTEFSTAALFRVVIFLAGLHLVGIVMHLHWEPLAAVGFIACVGGPALIAALHGLTSQIEIDRLEMRSASMERLLEQRREAVAKLDLSDPENPRAIWGLATEALATTSLFMDEAIEWSLLYRNVDIHVG